MFGRSIVGLVRQSRNGHHGSTGEVQQRPRWRQARPPTAPPTSSQSFGGAAGWQWEQLSSVESLAQAIQMLSELPPHSLCRKLRLPSFPHHTTRRRRWRSRRIFLGRFIHLDYWPLLRWKRGWGCRTRRPRWSIGRRLHVHTYDWSAAKLDGGLKFAHPFVSCRSATFSRAREHEIRQVFGYSTWNSQRNRVIRSICCSGPNTTERCETQLINVTVPRGSPAV